MTTHINTPNEKAPGAYGSKGLHINTNSADFATKQAIHQAQAEKSATTLIAKFALAGHAVHRGQTGDFIVSRWGQTRYCKNFAELQAFATKLGVTQ